MASFLLRGAASWRRQFFLEWPSFRWRLGHSFARLLGEILRTAFVERRLAGEGIRLFRLSEGSRVGGEFVAANLMRGSLLAQTSERPRILLTNLPTAARCSGGYGPGTRVLRSCCALLFSMAFCSGIPFFGNPFE